MNLEQLREEFKRRANDLSLRVQCPMDGDVNAEILIIGEGPGQNEVNAELPFVGESGKLLWNSLRSYHILRSDCYITNVCKRQISLGKNTRHPVDASEWIKWKHLIEWEIDQLPNIKHILCMGNAGLDALFGIGSGITKIRGSVLSYKSCNALVTFNPAAVIREPLNEIVFLMDIRRFNDVVQNDYIPYEIIKHINPSYASARSFIAEMRNGSSSVSFDIETISNHTACFGLANSGHEAMCINLRDKFENHFTLEQELQLLYDLQDLFENQKIIAQNGNFDSHWCGYKDLLDIKIHFDTMLAHHTLYPLLPHNLGFLTAQYTTHPFYKDDKDQWKEGGDIDSFWRYNATDAAITWEVARRLEKELVDQKLSDFFFSHVMRLDKHLVRSTVEGVLTDAKVKQQIAEELTVDLSKIKNHFYQQLEAITHNEDIRPNLNSTQQMRALFIDRLRLKSTTGSVDKPALDKMLDDSRTSQDVKDLIITYKEYKREQKFLSTYAESRVDNDNRFRMVWKQQGVTKAPGRLSCSGNLWGTASNIQNQPTRSHRFFISDPGTVMFYADGSQAEARVVAYLADIQKWKDDFERARITGDYDAHRALASDMYKVPYDNVPKEDWVIDAETGLEVPTIRYKGKRARHGLNYRMNFPRLAEAAKLSLFEAKKTYILYHNVNPEIKEWWRELEKIARTKREIFTPFGRRFRILQRIDEDALESIVAFVPQSTIGDLVKKVWYLSHEDDGWDMNKMRIKINVHDSLIGIAHPDYAMKALKIIKKHFETPFIVPDVYNRKFEQLIIPADGKISKADEFGIHRWSTLEKVKIE